MNWTPREQDVTLGLLLVSKFLTHSPSPVYLLSSLALLLTKSTNQTHSFCPDTESEPCIVLALVHPQLCYLSDQRNVFV